MKNAMQLKAIIKNLAKEKHISAQLVMQNFMLERLLERISVSKYQLNFILKGGFFSQLKTQKELVDFFPFYSIPAERMLGSV